MTNVDTENYKIVAKNKRARFDYEIIDTLEAGIELTGSEVKSIRLGKVSINESYIGEMANSDELFIFNADISPYDNASYMNHESRRPRKLLIHRNEINKFLGAIRKKGMTVIPLVMYFNHKGKIKLKISLAKGKNVSDKRETIKKRDWTISKARIFRAFNNNQ